MTLYESALPFHPSRKGGRAQSTMKEYELLYIVPAQFTDTEIVNVQVKIAKILTDAGAKVLRDENLGKIRLAYPIKTIRHGSYVLVHFDTDAGLIAELNRKLGLTDEVLRHMILERQTGALEKKYELSSYVAPLSEEARQDRDSGHHAHKPPQRRAPVVTLPLPTPVAVPVTPMSMEELDKKLDKILEGDIADNI